MKQTLGTLWGVYLPCLQNILGIILFLASRGLRPTQGLYRPRQLFNCA